MTAAHTAARDQLEAATAHAGRIVADLITRHGGRQGADTTGWANALLAALTAAVAAGNGRLCPHITTAPTVVYAVAWAPGHLMCDRCIAQLTPPGDEDTTCDRCRRQAAPIHPGATTAGPIVLTFGLCQPCTRRIGLTVPS
jgi:hypothetical protein